MTTTQQPGHDESVITVNELRGRPVISSTGERIGVVRDVSVDASGRIDTLEVRARWMLGPLYHVPAAGMRFEGGNIIVADAAPVAPAASAAPAAPAPVPEGAASAAPVLLAGHAGARGRFGGLDLLGSLFGAFVSIGALLVIGGVLAALFDVQPMIVDTSFGTFALISSGAMVVGAVSIFAAFLLGGWATGRSSRFDGVSNSLVMVLWVLVMGVVLNALGSWADDRYDVFAASNLPQVSANDFEAWGAVALVVAFVLMLLGAAIGGALGERWHRRADRAMFEVVTTDDAVDVTR